ncbi:iron-containing alcohol dehydrogenase-domain containing protein [Paecilomyces variotii]|uniref:Iron-containing alcohol dehydrogenase-domain containing protein n=1 Tax=Byssochlamys spectabilis TaxID=264951 RepID=A0A443I0G5_BYSSP|nr:iron-containing alcohol dehydrogenase-domain containing protein [Paecilomyces variotii]RWQ97548.1 iron-containing alcohol dehydrogenase-domain containing protein [Paecilomyces variotii]
MTERDRHGCTRCQCGSPCYFGSGKLDGRGEVCGTCTWASGMVLDKLGPLGVGHGETSCILLPAVCKYNASKNANNDSQQRVLGFLTSDPIVSEVLETRQVDVANADLGDVLDAIIRELGLPRSLADVGVGRDKLDQLAVNSLKDRCCVTNPVPLKEKEQVFEILEMVVGPQA